MFLWQITMSNFASSCPISRLGGDTQQLSMAALFCWWCCYWMANIWLTTNNSNTVSLQIICNSQKKFTVRNYYTYPNNLSGSSFGSKHAQNSRSTANIKHNLVLKQVPVVTHGVTICQCSHFVFQHLLQQKKHNMQALFTSLWYDAEEAVIQEHLPTSSPHEQQYKWLHVYISAEWWVWNVCLKTGLQ